MNVPAGRPAVLVRPSSSGRPRPHRLGRVLHVKAKPLRGRLASFDTSARQPPRLTGFGDRYIACLSNDTAAYPPAGIQETSPISFVTWSNLGWHVPLSAPLTTYGTETATATANGNAVRWQAEPPRVLDNEAARRPVSKCLLTTWSAHG